MNLETSNGAIYLTDVQCETLRIVTSNGKLVFNTIYAKSITGTTSNGRVEGDVEAIETVLATSNGKINLDIPCTVSGKYYLTTSNAEIKLSLLLNRGWIRPRSLHKQR